MSTARLRIKRIEFVERIGFFDAAVWIGDRSGPRTRHRRSDRYLWSNGIAAGSRSNVGPRGRSAARPTRPTPFSAFPLPPSWRATAHFTKVFEPAARRALQGFLLGAAAGSSCRSLDDLKPVFEVLTPGE